MLDALSPLAKLPMYKSHKIVRAAPILTWSVEPHATDHTRNEPHVVLDLGNDDVLVMPVPASFFGRGEPAAGDMFVLYGDGYKSWSPRKTFDEGNSPMAWTMPDGPTVRAVLILVNQALISGHSLSADVYILDASGWYRRSVEPGEEIGDVRRHIENREYQHWPKQAPLSFFRSSSL